MEIKCQKSEIFCCKVINYYFFALTCFFSITAGLLLDDMTGALHVDRLNDVIQHVGPCSDKFACPFLEAEVQ